MSLILDEHTLTLIDISLAEDLGSGDVTTSATISEQLSGIAFVVAKQPLRVCGHTVAQEVFSRVDSAVVYSALVSDGTDVQAGTKLARISGPLSAILQGERTALNFLQRLSGVATHTRYLVDIIRDSKVQLLDTRKTTPGWRQLEKYAVKVGGGGNHRAGLFDAVLIKNNHIDALSGDFEQAVSRCRARYGSSFPIEVEVRSLEEAKIVTALKPDWILLDNMSSELLTEVVSWIRSNDVAGIKLEASGGIRPENLRFYAATGVDFISMGYLTHGAIAVDIALRVQSNNTSP